MEWITSENLATAEQAAAQFIANCLARAIDARGGATLAISGGESPWGMFGRLAEQSLDWSRVHLLQVDERIAPAGHADRNWTRFSASALAARVPAANRHPMPVEIADSELAAARYAETLRECARQGHGQISDPPVLDIVHLGIGNDGHTASLFPDDELLAETQRRVGVSAAPHAGYRRVSLTLPTINAARDIVWYVVGAGRREVAGRLFARDAAIPASRVRRERATCFTDFSAAPET